MLKSTNGCWTCGTEKRKRPHNLLLKPTTDLSGRGKVCIMHVPQEATVTQRASLMPRTEILLAQPERTEHTVKGADETPNAAGRKPAEK